VFAEGRQRPFESKIILFNVLILHKVVVFLINRVVGEVHVLVVLVDLGGVGLGGKASQSLLEDVGAHGLVAGDEHVDAQVELVPVYQQRISHISTYHARLVHIHIVYIVYNVNAFALGGVSGLHYPDVLLRVVLLQLLVVGVEVPEFIRQDVCIWHEIEVLLSIFFLHLDHVETKSIFPGNFIALRKVVNLLVLIQSFIQIRLAVRSSPENIPLMRLSIIESIQLKHRPQQLIVKP